MKVLLFVILCLFTSAVALTGCGHLDKEQVSNAMRRCLDAGGIPNDSGPLLDGKHNVTCWMR